MDLADTFSESGIISRCGGLQQLEVCDQAQRGCNTHVRVFHHLLRAFLGKLRDQPVQKDHFKTLNCVLYIKTQFGNVLKQSGSEYLSTDKVTKTQNLKLISIG